MTSPHWSKPDALTGRPVRPGDLDVKTCSCTRAPSPGAAGLVDPGCNGGLCRWGNLLVASSLDDPADRRQLVLRTSADSGRTWSAPVVLDAGGAGYSVVQPLADGSLGVLYEAGDYDAIVFRRVTRAAFDRGLVARPGSGAARPPEVASVRSP